METTVVTIGANTSNADLHSLIDDAAYRCYAYNRTRTPNVSPERWAKFVPNVEALEQKFQEEMRG